MNDELESVYNVFVEDSNIALYSYLHDFYFYPINGWIWADSENEARSFLGLPLKDITKEK